MLKEQFIGDKPSSADENPPNWTFGICKLAAWNMEFLLPQIALNNQNPFSAIGMVNLEAMVQIGGNAELLSAY